MTDADGAEADVTRAVFVIDRPRVSVEVPRVVRVGEEVTLAATADDEFGETTVTWRFPDGSTATGETARYAFPRGESTVEVTVEDEFGAASTETVPVRTTDGDERPAGGVRLLPLVVVAVMLVIATLAFVAAMPHGR